MGTITDPLLNPAAQPHHTRDDSTGSSSSYGSTDSSSSIVCEEQEVFDFDTFQITTGKNNCWACDELFQRGDNFTTHENEHHGLTALHAGCVQVLSNAQRGCPRDQWCQENLSEGEIYRIPILGKQPGGAIVEIEEPFEICEELHNGQYYTLTHESVCHFSQEKFKRGDLFRMHQCTNQLVAFKNRYLTVLSAGGTICAVPQCGKDLLREPLRRLPTLEESEKGCLEAEEKDREARQKQCALTMCILCWTIFGAFIATGIGEAIFD